MVRQGLPDCEMIFVSDGSTDGSVGFLEAWARKDSAVKVIVLTRNFGHQSALSAGLTLRFQATLSA